MKVTIEIGMAKIIGQNDHLSKLARMHRSKLLALSLLYPIGIAVALLFPQSVPIVAGALALTSHRLYKTYGKFVKYRKGVEGEMEVERVLKTLSDSYVVINNVRLPKGAGNIDHVVIGPTGVFAIETKNIRGHFVCEGEEWFKVKNGRIRRVRSFSRQAKRNALALRDFLRRHGCDQFVHGVVVLTNENCRVDLINPSVPVIEIGRLKDFIEKAKDRVPKRRIYEIVGILVSESKHL